MPEGSGAEPRVLVVDDEPANLGLLHRYLEGAGYSVLAATDGPKALLAAARSRPDLVILDVVMPGMDGFEVCRRLKRDEATRRIPVVFLTGRGELEDRLAGFRAGGVDYITKPFEEAEVLARVRAQLEIARLSTELTRKNLELERRMAELRSEMGRRKTAERARDEADARASALSRREAERWGVKGFVGRSSTIRRILDDVRTAQEGDVGVLITGESGTGKELVARALHFGSPRRDGPFVPVNCASIPMELAESALFGHVEGAFSGAKSDHRGYFAEADGGTLFLDEVGDMPPPLQAKLLRALESGSVRPVGAATERCVRVRVLAAMNADPAERIAEGRLRRDLYFRLARFPVHVPPLRERREDVPLLARHFLDLFAGEMGRPAPDLTAEALTTLTSYDFPGNVRELKNMMEHALLRCRGEPVRPRHLHFLTLPQQGVDIPRHGGTPAPDPEAVILAHARRAGSVDNATSRDLLGVSPRQATYLLAKLVRQGRLERRGTRRWTHYVPPGGPEES